MNTRSIRAAWAGRQASLPLVLAVLAVLVFVTACGGIELTRATGRIAAIWIANALVVAALLHHSRRLWPVLLATGIAANFCADIAMGDTIASSLILSAINAVEILCVALPLRILRLDRDFTRTRALLVFYALALGPAPIFAAVASAAYLDLIGTAAFLPTATGWYAADALGLVIFVPPLLMVTRAELVALFAPGQRIVSLLLMGSVVAIAVLNYAAIQYPFAFLFFPAVVLLTFQRGFAGGAFGLLVAGSYLLMRLFIGATSGALAGHPLQDQMIIVQVFIAFLGFTVILVGAALAERRKLERGLAGAIGRAENAREEALVAKDAAEHASRTKSMFLANMSHELRTPLNAVIGFSEVMQTELFGPLGHERYRDYALQIHNAGGHLLELINDILDMSKIEAGKLELRRERLDLSVVMEKCAELLGEQAAQGGIALVVETGGAAIWLDADRRAMKQILLNLVSNALKFTPEGGRITVAACRHGAAVALSVSDTGIGIPADQLSRLGNPFVQVRGDVGASHKGTGLGLALVRALAQMHGGTFRIESVEGRGTTVTLDLPAAEADRAAA